MDEHKRDHSQVSRRDSKHLTEEKTGWQSCKSFVYNPKTGAFCSRTPKSWALILLFYLAFYTVLALFWYILFQIFMLTISTEYPKWQLQNGLIGSTPGLGVRPQLSTGNIGTALIRFSQDWDGSMPTNDKAAEGNAALAMSMEQFVQDMANFPNSTRCNLTMIDEYRGSDDQPCNFDPEEIYGDCGRWPFGYQRGAVEPCFIIKMNRIFGFKPEPLTVSDVEVPEKYPTMPDHIRNMIMAEGSRRGIYIDCDGQSLADKDAINGTITYFPEDQLIPMGFFPYTNIANRAHPSIAIKLKGVPTKQVINVVCKLWYKNVKHEQESSQLTGTGSFGFIIE